MPRMPSRSRIARAVVRSEACDVKSAMVLPFAATATSLTACSNASWYAQELGSGMSSGTHSSTALS